VRPSPAGSWHRRLVVTIVQEDGVAARSGAKPGAKVEINDPLEPHRRLVLELGDRDMHDVTAYLATLSDPMKTIKLLLRSAWSRPRCCSRRAAASIPRRNCARRRTRGRPIQVI